MAEIVGLVAAGGQFFEQGSKIIQILIKFTDKYGGEETKQWLGDVETLQNLLQQVKDNPGLQTREMSALLDRCEVIQREILACLGKVDFEAGDPKREKASKALHALVKDSDMNACFVKLGEIKQSLNLALDLRSHDLLQSINTNVQNLNENIDNLNSHVTDERKCLRELFVTDSTSDRDAVITAKGQIVDDTCDWITTREAYVAWEQSESGLLWVNGGPGKGKTYLSIALTKILQQQSSTLQPFSNPRTVIYFFCDYRRVEKRGKAISILRSLIYQLVQHHPDVMHLLLEPWRVQGKTIFEEGSFESLWRVFESMLQKLKDQNVYCVIDALDECEESSLRQLLSKVKSLFHQSTVHEQQHRMKLVLLSRRSPDILPHHLSNFPHIDLDQSQDSQSAVMQYISAMVAELARFKSIDRNHKLLNHIKSTFLERSEGTFLWVSFMVEDLKAKSISEIEAALRDLPVGLNQVYERILLKIQPHQEETIADILRWVAFAMSPLSLPELCEAVGVQGTNELSRQDVCESYVESCGHLLLVTGEPPKRTVSFVHQSAKDFMLKQQGPERYSISSSNGHTAICDRILLLIEERSLSGQGNDYETSQSKREDADQEETWVLANYAGRHWAQHMRLLDKADALAIYRKHKHFFKNNSRSRRWWRVNCNPALNQYYSLVWLDKQSLTPLELACLYGFRHLAEFELDRNRQPARRLWKRLTNLRGLANSGCSPRSLVLACTANHQDVIQLLLDHGADPNATGTGFPRETPLTAAITFGHKEAVRLLIRSGANPNLRDKDFDTPLGAATDLSFTQGIVRLLLEAGADPNLEIRGCFTLLHRTLSGAYKHIERTRLLLEFKANPNLQDEAGDTPLHKACKWQIRWHKKAVAMICLLLDYGADGSIRNKEGKTPLETLMETMSGLNKELPDLFTDSDIARLRGT
ncbi:hypothetical protein QBC43DRAFT_240047 [Cladorrhinum sp. PSN259]|nr:hypothetical protein QBC43DRAFT_240047 [Cladorrhinum sp. PSN259]